MLIPKVSPLYNDNGNPIANHHIIRYGAEGVFFQSYTSTVFMYDGVKMTFGRDWDYSKTTLKHLHNFLLRYFMPQTLWRTFGNSNPRTSDIRKAIASGAVYYDENLR